MSTDANNRKKKIEFELNETSMNIFNVRIEELRKDCDTYSEAIIAYCETVDCDIEDVLPLISNGLKSKMYAESIKLGTIIDNEPTLLLSDD